MTVQGGKEWKVTMDVMTDLSINYHYSEAIIAVKLPLVVQVVVCSKTIFKYSYTKTSA